MHRIAPFIKMFFGVTYATNPLAITVLQQLHFFQKIYSIFEYGFTPLYTIGYNVRKSLDLCRGAKVGGGWGVATPPPEFWKGGGLNPPP